MKIFIRDISPRTERGALYSFVNKAMRGPWYKGFASTGEIDSCEIIRIKDMETGAIEYHGVVEISPGKIGWEVISLLNGTSFMGRTVQVRKWFDRTGDVDRRVPLATSAQRGYERRKRKDRRREITETNLSGMSVSGVKGFNRTH